MTRYDRRTGQVQNVAPKPIAPGGFPHRAHRSRSSSRPSIRTSSTSPPTRCGRPRDGGQSWKQISPDLTRKTWERAGQRRQVPRRASPPSPRSAASSTRSRPRPLDINRIWAGTDDGLIQVTADGGLHWKDVTPPQLGPWAKVSIIDAGHFDAQTAYAAVNTLRLDDMRPHIYRTHDGGKTWTEIVNGIPDGRAGQRRPRRPEDAKGLLFAGTEREVYVSFDDGDHWQSLRLNMPATSMRDLIVKDDDLVVATHGRGFWILDDITPLRQIDEKVAGADAFLFKPADRHPRALET